MQSDGHAERYEDRNKNRNQIAIEKDGGNAGHRVPAGFACHGGLVEALGLAEARRTRDREFQVALEEVWPD